MISSLGKNIEDLKKREERESREIDEDKKKLADLTGRLQSVNESLINVSEEIHQLEEKRETISGGIEKSKSDLQLSEEKIAHTKEETGSKSSRLNSLKEFQESYKWSNEGIKTIIENKESRDKFYGVVADHINVPREYEAAVEAVLGEKLQYVIVKSQEDGMWAIDYLKNYQLGRGSFVPVEARSHNEELSAPNIPRKQNPYCKKLKLKRTLKKLPLAFWAMFY